MKRDAALVEALKGLKNVVATYGINRPKEHRLAERATAEIQSAMENARIALKDAAS